jgi:hypothetical protein
MMTMPEQIIMRAVGGLIPYARNARTHSAEQIPYARASMREFGFTNPVLIDGEKWPRPMMTMPEKSLCAQRLAGRDRVAR